MFGHYLNTLCLALDERPKISLTYHSESMVFKKHGYCDLCSSNGISHTNLLIMTWHFRNRSWISTAPVPIVSGIGIRT
jgi:hypothetical protein